MYQEGLLLGDIKHFCTDTKIPIRSDHCRSNGSPTHCKRSCTPYLSLVPPSRTFFNSNFQAQFIHDIHVWHPSLVFHSSIPFFLPYLSTPPSYPPLPTHASVYLLLSTLLLCNISPCTHEPHGTGWSCRCLPTTSHGRKSKSYHHLDCRCLQWGEQI